MHLTFAVNGVVRDVECDPRALLLDVLREELGLRGTKYGCGEGECGACTVLLDGRAVTGCLTTAGAAQGARIATIEGMARDEIGSRLIEAFVADGAVQCGFCTPGFVLAARALLARNPTPDADHIREALLGNLCRCTGYVAIVEAISHAAALTPPAPVLERARTPASIMAEGYARPATLASALRLLAGRQEGWRVIAGGTDLLVHLEHCLQDVRLLDIGGLDELRGVRETDREIRIGALTTLAEVAHSPATQSAAPALVAAALGVGGVQIRNMATIGGNLVNASPAADTGPPLYALGVRLVLRSCGGERTVPIEEFAVGPGRTALAPDELLLEIVVPKREAPGRRVSFFEKVGPRRAQTIAKASIALHGWLDRGRWRDLTIALGAVAPTVVAADRTADLLMSHVFDEALLARAVEQIALECAPLDDIRSTADYRRTLTQTLLARNLRQFTAGD